MDVRGTLLRGPGQPAVGSCNDATVSTHCPAMRGTVGREGYREEMILGRCADLSPSLSGVFRQRHRAARSNHHGAFRIVHIESIEIHDDARVLTLPLKAAVAGVKNYSGGAHGPTVSLVSGETNRADGVSLRSRVLPLPSAVGGLRADGSRTTQQCESDC